MPKSPSRSSLALALGLCLALPLSAIAQSESPAPATESSAADSLAAMAPLPVLEGLAWHRAKDLTGPEIVSSLPEDEVAEWVTLLDGAGASFDELEYTYDAAFDPSRLPDMGGMATVRVAGASEDALREAVVRDIVDQVVGLGNDAPVPEQTTLGEKAVTVVSLPSSFGIEEAIVYARDDVAYVVLMAEDLAAITLEQLP